MILVEHVSSPYSMCIWRDRRVPGNEYLGVARVPRWDQGVDRCTPVVGDVKSQIISTSESALRGAQGFKLSIIFALFSTYNSYTNKLFLHMFVFLFREVFSLKL